MRAPSEIILVHHEHFPELRIEDVSAEYAAKQLVNHLEAQAAWPPIPRTARRSCKRSTTSEPSWTARAPFMWAAMLRDTLLHPEGASTAIPRGSSSVP